jgi:hypothetical protein
VVKQQVYKDMQVVLAVAQVEAVMLQVVEEVEQGVLDKIFLQTLNLVQVVSAEQVQ